MLGVSWGGLGGFYGLTVFHCGAQWKTIFPGTYIKCAIDAWPLKIRKKRYAWGLGMLGTSLSSSSRHGRSQGIYAWDATAMWCFSQVWPLTSYGAKGSTKSGRMLSAISQKGRGVLNLKCYQYNLFAVNDPEFNWIWIAVIINKIKQKVRPFTSTKIYIYDIYDQSYFTLQILHEVAGKLFTQLRRQLKFVFNWRLSFRTLRRRYTVLSDPSERISSKWVLQNLCNPLT